MSEAPKNSVTITRDDWLKAVADAGIHSDIDDRQALTAQDYADMFGMPVSTAREHLAALVAAGKAQRTTKRGVTAYGRRISYQAYRLIQKESS